MQLLIFTDGGSRGNPGEAASAVIIKDAEGKIIDQRAQYLGVKTNNEAEYAAFALSLEWLKEYKELNQVDYVTWKLDSLLVVEQLNKKWKIKEPRMREWGSQIWASLAAFPFSYKIMHVPRSENADADALVNETLDSHAHS